jgi:glycerophosphoryl diester phosphodiesterase
MSLHFLFQPPSVAGEFGLVAHALGGIDGTMYTNSREAWEQSCAAGYRLIEVDLRMTADGQVVCFHERMPPHIELPGPVEEITRREFLAARYVGGYTPLDLDGLIELLAADERRYLVLDTAGRNEQILPAALDRFRRLAPAALARTIPEVYCRDDVSFVAGLCAWETLIFTCYLCDYADDAVVSTARHSAVGMVAMFGHRYNASLHARLSEIGRGVYVHTINDPHEAASYLARGVGVYTDFVQPSNK